MTVLRVTVLQIENRRNMPLQNLFLAHNRLRCSQEKGLEYVFYDRAPDDGIEATVPPYWWKVWAIRRMLLRDDHDTDAILWMDSDAYLGPADPRGLLRADRSSSMWISPDTPPLHHSLFCAGAFLVRNNAQGRAIFDRWWSLYQPDMWHRDEGPDGRWRCDGPWAGPAYEQGAFVDHILQQTEYQKHIRVMPYYVFSACNWWCPCANTIVVHLSGPYRSQSIT